jgi:hypothetical protein
MPVLDVMRSDARTVWLAAGSHRHRRPGYIVIVFRHLRKARA